ncbi:MAG TPA: GNAT family protein [Thermoplasmataceae archaeon]|nr:GNAT family protein [Thermoplasmataceae archaeon]
MRPGDILTLEKGEIRLVCPIPESLAPEIATAANDPVIERNIGSHNFPKPYRISDAVDFIRMNRFEGKTPFALDFAVMYNKEFAGIVGLKDIDYQDMKAHIGYWVKSSLRGLGIATFSVELISNFAKDSLRLHRLYTKVVHFNYASLKVLLKNGFIIEGSERESLLLKDGYHDMFILGKILH